MGQDIMLGILDDIARQDAGMEPATDAVGAGQVLLTVMDLDEIRLAARVGITIGFSSGPAWMGESGGRLVLKTEILSGDSVGPN